MIHSDAKCILLILTLFKIISLTFVIAKDRMRRVGLALKRQDFYGDMKKDEKVVERTSYETGESR